MVTKLQNPQTPEESANVRQSSCSLSTRDNETEKSVCLEFVLSMGLSKRCLELLSRRPTWSTAAFRCPGQNSRSITTGRLASLPRTPLFEAITSHDPESSAVIHSLSGRQFSYGSLLKDVAIAKQRLANDAGRDAGALQGERIAFLVENSYDYVGALCSPFLISLFLLLVFACFLAVRYELDALAEVCGQTVTLLAILGTNAIAVPLSPAFPSGELRYILDQSGALMLAASPKFAAKADDVLNGKLEKKPILSRWEKILEGSKSKEDVVLEDMKEDKGGMMLYTSGTTNRPVSLLKWHTRREVLTSSRKEYCSHNLLSWLRQNPSLKHGTTHLPITSSTSCLSTTSMAQSMPS